MCSKFIRKSKRWSKNSYINLKMNESLCWPSENDYDIIIVKSGAKKPGARTTDQWDGTRVELLTSGIGIEL